MFLQIKGKPEANGMRRNLSAKLLAYRELQSNEGALDLYFAEVNNKSYVIIQQTKDRTAYAYYSNYAVAYQRFYQQIAQYRAETTETPTAIQKPKSRMGFC